MKKPTAAFIAAGWSALAIFAATYLIALARMNVPDTEIYFYLTVFLFALFGVIAVVKSVRDKEEGIPVTGAFYGLSWVAALLPMAMIGVYLLAISTLNELQRGLLFLTFIAAIFAAIVVQKNTRDLAEYNATHQHETQHRDNPQLENQHP